MSTYTAHLMDCRGISDAARREAETHFCDALESLLSGPEHVVSAYRARFDTPESALIWERAERQATRAAFAGWHSVPDSAYFEINVKE